MDTFVGNRREIPGDLPPIYWRDLVREYEAQLDVLPSLAFYNPVMEYLAPAELTRLRAKVHVWLEITGRYPDDISTWWEVRQARRRGDIPHMTRAALATVDQDRVMHCGHCGARWTEPHPDRCKLCDTIAIFEEPDYDPAV